MFSTSKSNLAIEIKIYYLLSIIHTTGIPFSYPLWSTRRTWPNSCPLLRLWILAISTGRALKYVYAMTAHVEQDGFPLSRFSAQCSGSPLISFHGKSSELSWHCWPRCSSTGLAKTPKSQKAKQPARQSATGLSDFRLLLFPPIAPRRRHVNLLSRTQLKLNLSRLSAYIYILIVSAAILWHWQP